MNIKMVYVLKLRLHVNPTNGRLEQKADLTRLSYTLRLVPNIHWILVEDLPRKSDLVTNFLAHCKLTYTHLFAATPDNQKLKGTDPNWLKVVILCLTEAFDKRRNNALAMQVYISFIQKCNKAILLLITI